jgi:hypothetical protein
VREIGTRAHRAADLGGIEWERHEILRGETIQNSWQRRFSAWSKYSLRHILFENGRETQHFTASR